MKKLTVVLALLLVLTTTSVFALGIGAQAGYVVGGNPGGALTFKLDNAPWVFAVNVDRLVNPLSIGGTADMWLANKNFAGPFNYYYGWGVAAGLNIYDSGLGLYAGARALAGINVFVLDKFLEFYLQAAWQPGISLLFADASNVGLNFVNFPVNLGFRFWF
jgi:hypothetical protein